MATKSPMSDEEFVEGGDPLLSGENSKLKMDAEKHPIMGTKGIIVYRGRCLKCTIIVLVLALILAVAALFAVSAGLGITLYHTANNNNNNGSNGSNSSNSSLCLTASCVELASLVLSGMDQSVDPCADFYNFSCGAWAQKNIVPEGYARYSTFDQLAVRNQIALKKILESDEDSNVSAVVKVKDLYRSCINTGAINAQGATPLLEVINSTGGWSLLSGGNESYWDINGMQFLNEKQLSSPAFFGLYVDVDDKNSSNYILQLEQSGLSLPSAGSYLDNRTAPTDLRALETFIVSVLTALNPDIPQDTYQQAAEDIAAFETSLAEIFVSNVELRDPDKTYNKMTIEELSSLWPDYDWVNGTEQLFAMVNVSVNSSEEVIVRTPSYFTNLTDVFQSVNTTTLENYAKWQLIQGFLPYLGENFTTPMYKFTQVTQGSGQKERYKTCISTVQSVLPIALARPYTEFVLMNGTKGNVSVMISEVKNAFKQRLMGRGWLDNTTKQRSVDKVDAITQMVAYPDQIFNDSYLENLYAEYDITDADFFRNMLQYTRISTADNLQRLRKPVDKTKWLNAPTAVNAYYSPQFNQFVFLEGILNVPFFHAGWPDYFKYGALGVVIGHELTHGFDDEGQRYNKDGILTPWWTNHSIANFKKRQQCFVDQYSRYELFGYHVNGSLTLGENIADNGGLKSSYQAYHNVNKQSGQTPPNLPALPYTPDQLYFVAYGQVWCSLFTPQGIAASTKSDPHSPGPYRVIGALVNSPEFARAFSCPLNSTMNPEKKCLMW